MQTEDLNPKPTVDDIDRMIHEPARLKILLYLYVVEKADFVYLLHKTGLSKGNLSVQLQKLEQNGYVSIEKEFVNKIPRTVSKLTFEGRKNFEKYKEVLFEILQDV
jgi:DNA-binding MarR family transcriptional regulator